MIKWFLLITLVACFSCSKKQENTGPKYTAEEFLALSHEASVTNEKGEDAIKFSDYSPGVNKLDSKTFRYNRLVFFAIAFETEEEAKSEAKRLNQYYSRNWLFDRVEGEPVLEDYVISTFNAQNPNRSVQRRPKKAQGHGEAHGEAHAAPAHH